MATIVIRNLDEKVKRKLQVRAALNGRSMEAEVRATLADLPEESPQGARKVKTRRSKTGLATAIHRRFAGLGAEEIPIPPRTFSNRPLPKFDE
jgi:plasmid stability protein